MYILATISREIALDHLIPQILILPAGELGRDNHLIAPAPRLHPLAEPLLALAELVVDRRVDEVATLAVEVVEHSEGSILGALAEGSFPGVTEVHGAKAEGGNADAGGGREDAVAAEDGGWDRGWGKGHGGVLSLLVFYCKVFWSDSFTGSQVSSSMRVVTR